MAPRGPDERLVRLSEEEAARLARLYADAEREILDELNRALLRGNKTEYLRAMLENIQIILEDLRTGSRTWCEEAIPRIYVEGAQFADSQLVKAGVKVVAGFGAIHQQAAQVLAEAAYNRFEEVAVTIGRRADDIYRTMALENIRGSVVGYKTWQQVAKSYREQLAAQGVTGFKDRKDRQWNMRTYAEMVARTTTMEAHLQGTANRLVEHGHDLVKVSSHSGTCEKCALWQGKILSLTGHTAGYPTLQEAKDAGLFHPRCRHAYGLHIDLDAEINRLGSKLGEPPATGAEKAPASTIEEAVRRTFKPVGTMHQDVYNVLRENYNIKDPAVHVSQDTVEHIRSGHPELAGKEKALIEEILKNAIIVQRNKRSDTVRIIARNDTLNAPVEIYKPGKYIVLVLRLQPQHQVNFVKALYPRDKIRKSDIIWLKKEQ